MPADQARSVVTPAALARLPLITTPKGTSTRRQLDEIFALLDRRPNVAVETEHRDAMVPLVAAGAGVALVPRPAQPLAAGSGVAIAEVRPAVRRRIGLVHRTGDLPPAAQTFVELAVGRTVTSPRRPPARRRPSS